MQSEDYIIDDDGNFRFTQVGLENQASLLAKVGIDARSIKTYEQYLQARQDASPYFLEYLQEEIEKQTKDKPDTLEWQAIKSLVNVSQEEQDKLIEKIKRKQSFKII